MPYLELRGISKQFGATVALDHVDLSVEPGEVHCLLGENGSGKSTLMRILAGAIEPDSGEMFLAGASFRPRSPSDARNRGVAMIHQELTLCPTLSVAENISLGVESASFGILNRKEANRRAREALAQLGHPNLDPSTLAGELPIAMRQLVEIARAVAIGSQLVILDEPTSSLTQADVQNLFEVVRKLRDSGKSVIYISHFLDEVHALGDRMTVLRDGQNVGAREVKGVSDEEIVEMMVGREIKDMYPRSHRSTGDVILKVDQLAGAVKPSQASFELRRSEVFGIAGLNGSGRTELLRLIFGLDPVVRGNVTVKAVSGSASPAQRWSQGVGLLSEDRKEEGLLLNRTIAENTTLASLKESIVNPAAIQSATDHWIDQLSIKCRAADQAVGELSGGNQQKVAIARLLECDVDVLLLDEPTRGIDVGSKEQIYRLIDQLAVSGKAVLLVSSYLPELLGVCDRIAVMSRGELSEPVLAAEATQDSLMRIAVT